MTALPAETLTIGPAPTAGRSVVDVFYYTYVASPVRRPVLTASTVDAPKVKATPAARDAVILALVADKYRDAVAALPVQEDGPRVGDMLREFNGLSRARRRATRRLLGRG